MVMELGEKKSVDTKSWRTCYISFTWLVEQGKMSIRRGICAVNADTDG